MKQEKPKSFLLRVFQRPKNGNGPSKLGPELALIRKMRFGDSDNEPEEAIFLREEILEDIVDDDLPE